MKIFVFIFGTLHLLVCLYDIRADPLLIYDGWGPFFRTSSNTYGGAHYSRPSYPTKYHQKRCKIPIPNQTSDIVVSVGELMGFKVVVDL